MKKILITLILTSLFWYCDRIELKEANSMAQQNINLGSAYGDPAADKRRDAFSKCQDNFTELYQQNSKGNTPVKTRVLFYDGGTWNLDTEASKTISIDLTDIAVYNIRVMIKKATSDYRYIPLDYKNSGSYYVTMTGIILEREASGYFDSSDYTAPKIYILLTYESESSTLKSWEAGYTS